jgi:hypothetical protein
MDVASIKLVIVFDSNPNEDDKGNKRPHCEHVNDQNSTFCFLFHCYLQF